MKYIIKGGFLWILFFLFSCNKFTVVDTPTQVGISSVTFYVVFTLNGPEVQSIVVGTPYTDPGAKAEENGQPVQYTTDGTVDINTVGFYPITYAAVNKDGYSSSITRYVAVLGEAAQTGVDLSGTYTNVGTLALTADITKAAAGVFYTTNAWGGSSAFVLPMYFFSTDGVNITVPTQASVGEVV
ncbi:MAG TPA: DUF5011 domain-containing protein, partial [Puia sp.]|nr:DUF5011 domain-containing protein [Puia sp.]